MDYGLAAIVFVTPLLFGGRHPIGQFVFVALCGFVATTWFARQAMAGGTWVRGGALWILLLAVGVTALQIVQLPSQWIATLSPRLETLLPLWSNESSISTVGWNTLSLAPFETKKSLAILVAYTLLFITATQRLRTRDDIGKLLKWIGISAFLAAVLGVVQYLIPNGKLLWFYEYPYVKTNKVLGSFTNRNHFAHFLILGFAPLVAYSLSKALSNSTREGAHGTKRSLPLSWIALGAAAIFVLTTVLLTLSRGGALALGASMVVLAGIYWRAGIVKLSGLGMLGAVGLLAVMTTLSIYGFDSVATRLDDFASGSFDDLDAAGARRQIWSANLAAIQSGGIVGSGAGTHQYIYPAYLPEASLGVFTHAENGYLQIITENGLPGALLLLLGIGCCAVWCWGALMRSLDTRATLLAGAVCASLVGSMVHALVDFVWYVPACMAVTVLLAACALCLNRSDDQKAGRSLRVVELSKPLWFGLTALVLLSSGFATAEFLGPAKGASHWHKFQLAHKAHKKVRIHKAISQDLQQETQLADRQQVEYMIGELQKVIAAEPDNGRAHLKLALQLLRLFELQGDESINRMPLEQIRDSSIRSNFSSAQELREWMTRAFGERCELLYLALSHTRRAIQLAPLQSEAYLYLSRLCFLEGRPQSAVEQCLAQAFAVAPNNTDVLFVLGRHYLESRQLERAFEYWRPLFQCTNPKQFDVLNIVATPHAAEMVLVELQPDSHALPYLWKRYSQMGTEADADAIEQYVAAYAAQSKQDDSPDALALWRLLARIQQDRQHPEQAFVSLKQATQIKPDDFSSRHELGLLAMKLGHYRVAKEQLSWCFSRAPDNQWLRQSLQQLEKLRLSQNRNKPTGTSPL